MPFSGILPTSSSSSLRNMEESIGSEGPSEQRGNSTAVSRRCGIMSGVNLNAENQAKIFRNCDLIKE